MFSSKEWEDVPTHHKTIISPFLSGAPVKVGSIANALGISVKSSQLPSDVSGKIYFDANEKCIIKVNANEVHVRQRYTVAHEIGHFLLHRDLIGDGLSDNILYRSRLTNQQEAEANRLAADLLMPRHLIEQYEKKHGPVVSKENTIALASFLKASELAVKIRLGIKY